MLCWELAIYVQVGCESSPQATKSRAPIVTVASTRDAHRLISDASEIELTAEALKFEIQWFVENENRDDFVKGPYIYSISVVERGDGSSFEDATYLYHDQIYARGPDVSLLMGKMARADALLDVSLHRPSMPAEHKRVRVLSPEL